MLDYGGMPMSNAIIEARDVSFRYESGLSDAVSQAVAMVEENAGADAAGMFKDYGAYAFFAIGGISLLSIFINAARSKKRLFAPKRAYAKKYDAISRSALKEGANRVVAIKADKGYLMTRNDRKMADIGAAFQWAMDRNVDEYE